MKLERVVIGMDFSDHALDAARWTAQHFAPDAELILVHVVELPEPPSFLRAAFPTPANVEENARHGAEQRLREVGIALGAEKIWPEVRVGRPADKIAEVAQEFQADLIVVGEHGHTAGLRGILGSTAEYLARSSPVPVLLTHGAPDRPPKRILLPVEESPLMDTALAWGRLLAETFGATADGFYVISSSLLGRMRMVSSSSRTEELEGELLRDATRWLEERLAAAGITPELGRAQVVIGDPATEIIAGAQRLGSDLIILPTRGAGGVRQTLIGSVARSVIRGAPCSIFIVNHPVQPEGGQTTSS